MKLLKNLKSIQLNQECGREVFVAQSESEASKVRPTFTQSSEAKGPFKIHTQDLMLDIPKR